MSNIRKPIQQEVVEGIVRCVRELSKHKGPVGLSELLTAAEGEGFQHEKSSMFVLEFIKDGISDLTPEDIEKIFAEDYEDIWRMTNLYLQRFGYAPITPCEVRP